MYFLNSATTATTLSTLCNGFGVFCIKNVTNAKVYRKAKEPITLINNIYDCWKLSSKISFAMVLNVLPYLLAKKKESGPIDMK